MLSSQYKCVKNPGSYNSQVGVPLSVWQMSDQHELGIFEAGISLPGEMDALQKIIQPTIGLFTMLGSAHDEGFSSSHEKLLEKLKLFASCKTIVYCHDNPAVREGINSIKKPIQESLSWGKSEGSNVLLEFNNDDSISLTGKFGKVNLVLPFTDAASQENVLHCIMMLLHLGYSEQEIQKKIDQLRAVPMRLELKQGINQCQVIDDTYNNDLGGLRISL
ncbi:MAG: Mur ligase family protein, partial [Cyclobacteriaceae bacterium]